jgi:signal transduction histidine kinase/ligand-binding sensor domain-containing protein
MLKQLLVYICCFFSIGLSAQNTTGTHTLYQYTTENGLPSNLIRGIQWDNSTGFLWIITESGLVRFNGVEFKSYNKEKISPLAPEKQVYAVKNNDGGIFISDGSGNLFAVKKNKPVLSKPSSLSSSFLNYHFIAVSDAFFNAKIKAPPVFSEPFEKVIGLSDTSCLVLFQNSVYRCSVSRPLPEMLFKNITALFEIDGHRFFTDNNKQVFLFNTTSFTVSPVHFPESNKILPDFGNTSSQLFWKTGMNKPVIIKDNEAWQLNYSNGNIVAKQITRQLPTDANISTVEYLEERGMLFIGTDSKGLIVINQNKVLPKKRINANPKNKNAYFSQIALDNGNILTNEGDIIGDNPGPAVLPAVEKFSNRTSFTNGNLIWYNSIDNKSGIYCLHQFNKTTNAITIFYKIKPLTQVAISNGKTYLANNEGIGLFQGDSMYYLYRYPAAAANVKTYDFKEITPGVLAIAGCHGLLKFTVADNKLDTIYSRENACFGSIWKYKDYIFWGSYGYGYYVYKNGRIKEMPVDKNEYLLYCHCFVEDAYGNCWISTNRGLFKTRLNDIITNFETGTTPVYYHYFGKKDGIEMTELNGGCTPCAIMLNDQTISFPSMDGLLWVNPATSNPFFPDGDIYVDEIIVDGREVNPDSLKNTTLRAGVQEIVLKLGYSAWCNQENLYIDYQLNDTVRWRRLITEENTSIRLSNLPPGKYRLRIRKLNGFGINNYSYKTIEFTIAKQWFNKWWFYVLIVALLSGIIYFIGKLRHRQYIVQQRKLEQQVAEKTKELKEQNSLLEKNNSIKTRLISIISHDIITPLKFVTVAGKNLIEKRKLMPEELQQETIREMTNTSQELQLLSTNILNWIKYQNENRRMAKETFNLNELVNQVLGILQSLARQKSLVIENKVDIGMEVHQYYEPLKILVYNLLTNAIHFTEKGVITVSALKQEEHITISVKDQGIGMTPEQIQRLMAEDVVITSANVDNKRGHGLGYLIIKDLLKTMGATLHIESQRGAGTTVSVVCNDTNIS